MTTQKLPTKFAPAERAGPEEIERQSRLFASKKLLGLLPNAVPCVVVAINEFRQIVFANDRLAALLPPEQAKESVLGRRPGEVLGCVHADETEGGCGTTEFCSLCGAVHAVLTSQSGHADVRECRIARHHNSEALELRVWATPVTVDGERFSIVAALDISHEKRRQALEHIFLHDIYNVAYGLKWYTDFLRKGDPQQVEQFVDSIQRLCRELIEEIDAQKILIRAESGELVSSPQSLGTLSILQEAVELYRQHPVSQDRHIVIADEARDIEIVSDRTLLLRVVCNLLKNALEASRPGGTVTMACVTQDDDVEFWVHNDSFMPRDVQLQVFQRSFSTKGPGRGLGTYSIRLLTERYLNGHVSFTSLPAEGTTFRVRYPVAPREGVAEPGRKAIS
jgi:signal transduction histidine kinase